MLRPHILVLRVQVPYRRIIKHQTVSRPDHIMKRGLREIRGGDGCLSHSNLGAAVARSRLCLNLRIIPAQKDEQTPFGACILQRDSHELLDQLAKNNLARERLGSLDHSLQVQLPDRRADCGGDRSRKVFLVQARVAFVELLHLTERAPAVVAVTGAAKIGVADRFDAAGQVVSRRDFMGQALILHEAVFTRQMDSLLVQLHGVGVSLFEAGDLGRDQCVLVGERRWIVFGPLAQLFPMRQQEVAPGLLLVGRRVLIACRRRHCGIIDVVEHVD